MYYQGNSIYIKDLTTPDLGARMRAFDAAPIQTVKLRVG
jgi:hypothetical protein